MNANDKKKVWSLRYTPGNSETDAAIEKLAREMKVSKVTAGLIYNRGFSDAKSGEAFMRPTEDTLHDPFLMKDMDRAVERVSEAIRNGERITVYGDYDVDGVTSVTLLYLYLKSLGADVNYYIPLRAKEGYGVSRAAIDTLSERGTRLIITVDTGITANKEVEYAKELGIDTVVTDHHECHGELPLACAVVNPHRPDCTYPFCELAGVGVVFKFVCGYEIARCPSLTPSEAMHNICEEYIDLVAVGTVADVMPLVDENRVIVKLGLALIDGGARVGLAALIEAANNSSATRPATGVAEKNTKKRKINSGYISFSLAPRINAAGRISSASKAVELLLAEDSDKASSLADELCEINLIRQREENSIAEQAYKVIEESHDFERDKVIVLENDTWQQGIIGIVSSRITEKYGLPSILISFAGATDGDSDPHDVGKGSGRSVKGINLVEALDHCKEHLVQFGGHELAAGLSVMRCNIPSFRRMINDYARESFPEDIFVLKYEADCEIPAEELSMGLVDEISMLEPFGVANQSPMFLVSDMTVERVISMGAGKHTKLMLSSGGKSYTAVCFGMSASSVDFHFGEKIDILCQLAVNEFRGQKSLQLIVQDIRLSPSLEARYEDEKTRYKDIVGGASHTKEEDLIPTRADVAHVYKFLRYEGMCGHTMFSYRVLHSAILEQLNIDLNSAKLRFIIDILADMKVCEIERYGDDLFEFEVSKNAQKSNVELTSTYKMLAENCRA
ncbi:MAG: single-stranded-DNA-specific exonuclease RecJ [Clostridia bacterium]|nr:single-stranded-DNA-specific exonuclease RecJ [Clostridia bacterium]